ncbi:MAG: MBL fold metallo-hydrolase [Pseudomonadales bacterium]|jgi:hydroxyacylglutathione hydrolase|nr:MBL fold metallo-hydrolase [Pseudomonadales bacterium]
MFVEKVRTEGLAHLSWVVGSGTEAAVVDPRRDVDVYLDIAHAHGCRITRIFETHRNEDLVSGAPLLAARTGAAVHHGPNPAEPIAYAETVRDGDRFTLGGVELRVLETPGHTDDSISLALYDPAFAEDTAFGVFTGDALFVGDVGRTDFYPDRAEEVAGLLHDSLGKLLALGDQAVLYPAHGAGSVCGSGMADREVSTIGFERRHNPRLQLETRAAFVAAKLAEHHEKPPYFTHMERLNTLGAEPVRDTPPAPLSAAAFRELADVRIVDVREVTAFLGAHLPGSLSLPVGMIAAWAGWLLEPSETLVLVAADGEEAAAAVTVLARIGFDRIAGYLAPGLPAWAAGGRAFETIPAVDTETVRARLRGAPEGWTLLDVRGVEEVEAGRIDGSAHRFLGELPRSVDALDRGGHYTVLCGSGARATVAASVLRSAGVERVDAYLGSMGAWKAAG